MARDGTLPRCGTLGLGEVLRFGLLGGYDGADSWTLALGNVKDDAEQRMAELHEGLHHELQLSTGWGLVSGMALLLSGRGVRRHGLGQLFQEMVEEARETHELFATCLSATADGTGRARELLAGNPRYLGYLDRGLALLDDADGVPWQFHHAAVSSVLRACMQPAATLELLERGFGQLSRQDLDRERDSPDRRLAAFERLGGPSSWRPVFRELLERYPDRGGDRDEGQGTGRGRRLPQDPAELERLHQFEAEVLLPRCHAHACDVLAAAGLGSVGSREQSRLATALHAAVRAVDPELAGQLVLATQRGSLAEEALDLERQRIVLRERRPAQVLDERQAFARRDPFVTRRATGRRQACALWIDGALARKQFAFPAGTTVPGLVAALIARPDAASPRQPVRLGLLPADTTPQQCQRKLGAVALTVLTTHATLAAHGTLLAALQTVEPVFVLMDLPVRRHVGHWIRQGATVRVWASTIGRPGAELGLTTFAIGRRHPFVFFRLASEASTYLLVEQMRERYPDNVEDGAAVREASWREGLDVAVDQVLDAWHVLDQRGDK